MKTSANWGKGPTDKTIWQAGQWVCTTVISTPHYIYCFYTFLLLQNYITLPPILMPLTKLPGGLGLHETLVTRDISKPHFTLFSMFLCAKLWNVFQYFLPCVFVQRVFSICIFCCNVFVLQVRRVIRSPPLLLRLIAHLLRSSASTALTLNLQSTTRG